MSRLEHSLVILLYELRDVLSKVSTRRDILDWDFVFHNASENAAEKNCMFIVLIAIRISPAAFEECWSQVHHPEGISFRNIEMLLLGFRVGGRTQKDNVF